MMNSVFQWDGDGWEEHTLEDWWPPEVQAAGLWWVQSETSFWPLRPEDWRHLESALAISPRTRVALGPTLRAPRRDHSRPAPGEPIGRLVAGRYLPEWGALVSIAAGEEPVRVLAHELYHAVRNRLPDGEAAVLEAHGAEVRGHRDMRSAEEDEWIQRRDEAGAAAFDAWFFGARPPGGIQPPAGVKAIWNRIAAGEWA